MARRRYPVFVFVTLVASVFREGRSSHDNPRYVLPPPSMLHEQQHQSAATLNSVHVAKPPEILLRNTLLKSNAAFTQQAQNHSSSHAAVNVTPPNGHNFPASPTPVLVPVNTHAPMTPPGSLSLLPENSPIHTPTNFPTSHAPATNRSIGSAPSFHSDNPPFNSFNEVERFINFVPMDYENGGQMPGFIPPHQKREVPAANRRAGHHGPPPRRNSTLKNIISSFHQKVSRIFLGSRRRGPKPMRQPSAKPQLHAQTGNLRFDEARNLNSEVIQTPANDRSFTAALNTVAQMLQQQQYFPMMGKRERVRTLSQDESQNLDTLRRRDRKGNRRRPYRRRHPRKRRPHPRDRPPYEDDSPLNHEHEQYEQPYHDEEEYPGKQKSNHFPKHFDDEFHKDHGPPYKSFKSFKAFKPWKPNFAHESHEDHDEHYRSGGHKGKGRKPAWYPDSDEKSSFRHPNHYQAPYHSRPHHHEKYKEYSPESHYDSGSFKPIRPYYGGFGKSNFKDWDEKKMKFHKVIEYDHGIVGTDHFGPTMKHGASIPAIFKEEDARIPKIIINHHHNLPPASGATNFMPGPFPGNSVVSYSPPVHFQDDFFRGSGSGRGSRSKKEYRTNEFADSFIVNDYGKPPITAGFGVPSAGFGVRPQIHNNPGGPPPGVASSPPMGGHMVFDHFAQNMPPHFMHAKLPTPNLNQVQFSPHAGSPVSFSNSNTHFPNPMLVPGGHFPNHSPGFQTFGRHPESMDAFGKPSQMASYNNMNPHFPQSGPPGPHGYSQEGVSGPGPSHGPPPGHLPPPDSSPFPSTNEHQDPHRYIPPFSPVPHREEDMPPTQGPITPASRESFFKLSPPRTKSPRKFQLTIVKSLSSGFDIPDKLTNHPLAQQNPTPMMNYFDIEVPDREHYKKKQQRTPNPNSRNSNNHHPLNSIEDHPNQHSSLPSLNKNQFDSNEFNYSTLPENWRNFRPDPSHDKLPSLTHDSSPEIGSRMFKIRSALSPKSLVKALMNRFPRSRIVGKNNRAHTKFTPFDAIAKSREDMGSSNRKRRKSTKTPASIQDIIDSDSSNHNKEIMVSLSEDELNNNSDQKDHHEGGASMPSPVIVMGKGRAKKPKQAGGEQHISNEMQTEMPFNSEVDDDVLLGMHTINIPLQAEIRMGDAAEEKKKK